MAAEDVPNPYLDQVQGVLDDPASFGARTAAVSRFSFTVPSARGLQLVARYSHDGLLDPLAGTGYWGSLLNKMGIRTTLTDMAPVGKGNTYHDEAHADVEQMDGVEAVRRYGDDHGAMLLSWVPYDSAIGEQLPAAYTGNTVIVIGEGCGGCCGTDEMFETLDRDWDNVASCGPPQWRGLHDTIQVYRRRAPHSSSL
ncbi:MAG: hypothetical protein M3Y35_04710 [Actinomycetota bacterium]|nr:hypothetical protein [Actinomycetota bacterium]